MDNKVIREAILLLIKSKHIESASVIEKLLTKLNNADLRKMCLELAGVVLDNKTNAREEEGIPEDMPPEYLYRTSALPFETRTMNLICRERLNMIGDIVACSKADYYSMPGFGRKTVAELREVLSHRFNLDLNPTMPEKWRVYIQEHSKIIGR